MLTKSFQDAVDFPPPASPRHRVHRIVVAIVAIAIIYAVAWGVAMVSPQEIDEINILNASILAMHRALDQLTVRPEYILVDGNRFKPYHDIPFETIVKGDATMMNIAAASILAKTHRDAYMRKIAEEYPQYHWDKNKGYPTREHYAAIEQYDITPYHRKSFCLHKQLSLF